MSKVGRSKYLFSEYGFTLIELLIGIVLLSSLTLIATYSGQNYISGAQEYRKEKEFLKNIRDIRTKTQKSGAISSIKFLETSYEISDGTSDFTVEVRNNWLLSHNLNSEKIIYFYPDGTSSGGVVTVLFGSKQRQISIGWMGALNID